MNYKIIVEELEDYIKMMQQDKTVDFLLQAALCHVWWKIQEFKNEQKPQTGEINNNNNKGK
jgi:hypothetical protein